MKCQYCKSENPDNARFCNQCGAVLSGESLAISIIDAAKIIGVSTQTILNLIERGCLTQMGSGDHRRTYVSRESVIRFANVIPDFSGKLKKIRELQGEQKVLKKKLQDSISDKEPKALFVSLPVRDTVIRYLCDIFLTKQQSVIMQEYFFKLRGFEDISIKYAIPEAQVRSLIHEGVEALSRIPVSECEALVELGKKQQLYGERITALEKLLAENGIEIEEAGLPISDLCLTPMTEKALNASGIFYISQLTDMTFRQLNHIPGIGPLGMDKLLGHLRIFGFHLKPELLDDDVENDDEDEEIIYDENE